MLPVWCMQCNLFKKMKDDQEEKGKNSEDIRKDEEFYKGGKDRSSFWGKQEMHPTSASVDIGFAYEKAERLMPDEFQGLEFSFGDWLRKNVPPLRESDESSNDSSVKRSLPSVPFWKLFRYADWYDLFLMVSGAFSAIILGICYPALALLFGRLIDGLSQVQNDGEINDVQIKAIIILIIGGIAMMAGYFQIYTWNLSANYQANRIRERFLEAVLKQEMAWFDEESVSSISNRMNSSIFQIQQAIGDKVSSLIECYSTFIAGLVAGFYFGWQLAIIVLAVIPVIGLTDALFSRSASHMSKKNQTAYEEAASVAEEVLHGIKTVKAFNSRESEVARYEEKLKVSEEYGIKSGLYLGILHGLMLGTVFISYGFILWYGSRLIINKTVNDSTGRPFSAGDIMSIMYCVMVGSFGIGRAAPFTSAISTGKVAARKVFEIIDRVPLIQSPQNPISMLSHQFHGKITFSNVFFAYPSRPDLLVLSDINIEIKPGKLIAFVGESGSGKSSILALLQRFYDPQVGRVLLDGINIRRLNLEHVRSLIGYVGQNPILFAGTIKENIIFGDQRVSDEELIHACKNADAHDFIQLLPDGYDTYIGGFGNEKLSGGQIQRIAIARALLREPRILLLDEYTSNLDCESESRIQNALQSVLKDRTVIVVAHRLSTMRNADEIFVFKQGRIVEKGKHDDLMSMEGVYHGLVCANDQQRDSISSIGIGSSSQLDTQFNSDDKYQNADSDSDLSIGSDEDLLQDSRLLGEDSNLLQSSKSGFSRVMRLALNNWIMMLTGSLASVLNGLIFPSLGILITDVVIFLYNPDTAVISKESRRYLIFFALLAVGQFCTSFFSRWSFSIVGEKLTALLRVMCFDSIIRQDIAWFDMTSNSVEKLCIRLGLDTEKIRSLSIDWLGQVIQISSMLLIGVSYAFYRDWKISLFMLGVSPLVAIGGIGRVMLSNSKEKDEFEKAAIYSTEVIANVKVVASFCNEQYMLKKFRSKISKSQVEAKKSGFVFGITYGIAQIGLFSMLSLSFWFSSWLVARNYSTFSSTFPAFYVFALSFLGIGQVLQLFPTVESANDSVKDLFDIIDRKPLIDDNNSDGIQLNLKNRSINAKKVSFCYQGRQQTAVLHKLSFSLSSGKFIALVGLSGGGKSSIFQLLLRFYETQHGKFTVDGIPLDKLNLLHYRNQIGWVSQNSSLFDLSIAENIAYGQKLIIESRVLEVLDMVNLLDFVHSLPFGIHTKVGRRGEFLSGGQRQRIAIARALYKNPNLLLLDEATSSLDSKNECEVTESLRKAMENRTSFVISHRLSTIRDADEIWVLQNGRIREIGTHEELAELPGGLYASLLSSSLEN